MSPSWSSIALVVMLGLFPASARAAARPPEPRPEPLPEVIVEGEATIDARSLRLRCRELGDDAFACDVELRFRLTTSVAVVLRRVGDAAWSVVRDDGYDEGRYESVELGPILGAPDPQTGEPSTATPCVVDVTLRFGRDLAIRSVDRTDFWVLSPLHARHIVLGDGGDVRREGETAYGELIAGDAVTRVGEVAVDVDVPDPIAVNLGGQPIDGIAAVSPAHDGVVLTVMPGPEAEPSPIQHGGPVLAIGARFDLNDDENTLVSLRGGYELAIAHHFFGSLAIETDFDAIYESLVFEAASPELLVLLPSVSAGLGVVARQLGDRDADAALRLRLGMGFIGVGLTCDFDYWPAIGEWTAAMVARISI